MCLGFIQSWPWSQGWDFSVQGSVFGHGPGQVWGLVKRTRTSKEVSSMGPGQKDEDIKSISKKVAEDRLTS